MSEQSQYNEGTVRRFIVENEYSMVGFNDDIRRIKYHNSFRKIRQYFTHVDDGSEPEPKLQNHAYDFFYVSNENGQSCCQQTNTKGEKLLKIVNVGDQNYVAIKLIAGEQQEDEKKAHRKQKGNCFR